MGIPEFCQRNTVLCDVTDYVHIYSGSLTVVPTSQYAVTQASKILRKVMLYPEPESLTNPTS